VSQPIKEPEVETTPFKGPLKKFERLMMKLRSILLNKHHISPIRIYIKKML
jgi:hypothetical protein